MKKSGHATINHSINRKIPVEAIRIDSIHSRIDIGIRDINLIVRIAHRTTKLSCRGSL